MMELMAMLQQQQQQQHQQGGSPACSDTVLSLDDAGGDEQLDQAIDQEIQQLMQLKQAMQQRQQARLNNSSAPAGDYAGSGGPYVAAAPGCVSPMPLSTGLISPANSVTLPLLSGSTVANNWPPSSPNLSPQPLPPNSTAPGPMVRHSIDMGVAGHNGFLPPAMPVSQQQQPQLQHQQQQLSMGGFQAPGGGFGAPGAMRHSIDVSMPAATQLQLQQQLQQQQQQLLALSTTCGLTGALSGPLSQDLPLLQGGSSLLVHPLSQQQAALPDVHQHQQSLLYSSVDGAFAVSTPNLLPQTSPFAAASDLCAFTGNAGNRLSLDAIALQQPSAELAAFVAGPGSTASSNSYFVMGPTSGHSSISGFASGRPEGSSRSFTGPTSSQGYCGYAVVVGGQGAVPLPRKAGSFTAGCGQTSGFASSAWYAPGPVGRDGSCSSRSPRSSRLEAELFGDASGLVLPAAACSGRAAGGGGGRGGAPLMGANGQPLNSSAPRWAGSFWHPLAEVVRTGQLSNKGTGVFIPGGVKPPVPAAAE